MYILSSFGISKKKKQKLKNAENTMAINCFLEHKLKFGLVKLLRLKIEAKIHHNHENHKNPNVLLLGIIQLLRLCKFDPYPENGKNQKTELTIGCPFYVIFVNVIATHALTLSCMLNLKI